jgi:hypothetical protein
MDNNQNKDLQGQPAPKAESSKILTTLQAENGFVFALKKTERLTPAVYLITGFFDDKEPIKWKLRSLASELLSASLVLNESYKSGKDRAVSDMKNIVLEIGSLLTVAKNAGLMSDMNYKIIDEEFSNLLNSIASDSKNTIPRDFFAVPIPDESRSLPAAPVAPVQHIERAYSESPKSAPVNQSHVLDKGHTKSGLLDDYTSFVKKEPKKEKEAGAVSLKKNSRQTVILDIVKKKKEIMIKDVSPLISGCSEKTIQRELLAMVNAGILKKEGEKRWSRYSLATE